MPTNATRNIEKSELDSFLGNGWFLGLGRESCLVAWGRPKKSKKPVADKIQFYVPDFYLEDPSPWVTFESVAVVSRSELIEKLQSFTDFPTLDLSFQDPDRQEFERNFLSIQEKLNRGDLNKVVPSVFAKGSGTMTKAARAKHIIQLLKNAFKQTPYGYMTPAEGIMGASPENLFTYDPSSGCLTTVALAGSRCSTREKSNSILNDEKEVYEHQLVVKGIKEKLSALGEMEISPTYVWDLGLISHLRTDISIDLHKKMSAVNLFLDICHLLHPTAALGVSPQTVDWRLLREYESEIKRKRFGAPFGVLSPEGKSMVYVAIRNVQWNEDGVFVGTGCGVVRQSQLESEWEELNLKRRTIYHLLGL